MVTIDQIDHERRLHLTPTYTGEELVGRIYRAR